MQIIKKQQQYIFIFIIKSYTKNKHNTKEHAARRHSIYNLKTMPFSINSMVYPKFLINTLNS